MLFSENILLYLNCFNCFNPSFYSIIQLVSSQLSQSSIYPGTFSNPIEIFSSSTFCSGQSVWPVLPISHSILPPNNLKVIHFLPNQNILFKNLSFSKNTKTRQINQLFSLPLVNNLTHVLTLLLLKVKAQNIFQFRYRTHIKMEHFVKPVFFCLEPSSWLLLQTIFLQLMDSSIV